MFQFCRTQDDPRELCAAFVWTVPAASDWLRADDETVRLLPSVFIMTYIECYGQFSVIIHFGIDRCTVFALVNAFECSA